MPAGDPGRARLRASLDVVRGGPSAYSVANPPAVLLWGPQQKREETAAAAVPSLLLVPRSAAAAAAGGPFLPWGPPMRGPLPLGGRVYSKPHQPQQKTPAAAAAAAVWWLRKDGAVYTPQRDGQCLLPFRSPRGPKATLCCSKPCGKEI